MLLEKSGEIASERMKRLSQSGNNIESGDKNEVQCCKEQNCIGTWNVRSMNQGKLDVVKQEMARGNTDILGFSKLKWIRMGEFNSDDHCIHYRTQESLRRNGIVLTVNQRV